MQSKYEILTDDGWSDFHGVRKQTAIGFVKIILETGEILECSLDHKIMCGKKFKEAKDLSVGDSVNTKNGKSKIKEYQIDMKTFVDVYDALHVEKNNKYLTNNIVSHNCQFLGSSGTLISSDKLKALVFSKPLLELERIKQYEKPAVGHTYVMTVDVSRGKGLDYSTFSVIDVSQKPTKQVCTFKDNLVTSTDFASIIFRIATLYNNAHLLVEINDIGGQVADILYFDYGYEELIYTSNNGRNGKQVSGGFKSNVDRGIRTTKTVKTVGCSILKLMIEQDQLLINDFDTIQELYSFSRKGNSYEAESGAHDDMVMTLVLYAWLTDQTFFKDLTDTNMMELLREKSEEQMQEDLLPFGFVNDGLSDFDFDDGITFRTASW